MPVSYGGTTLSLLPTSTPTAPASTGAGWNVAATVGTAAIDVWGQVALASQNSQMQKDLAAYNNSMQAIMQGLKQFTADKNRSDTNDARIQESQNIDLDKMRAEAQLTTQAAFTGASSSAKAAAMFDVDRNALTAKFNSDTKFENALAQIQLSEYSSEMQQQSVRQSGNTYAPSALDLSIGAVAGLANKSIKSGAWDKGGSLRTYASDLFNNSSAKLP